MNSLFNHYRNVSHCKQPSEGMYWPEDQAIPSFAPAKGLLDSLSLPLLSDDLKITFSALQGHVNKKKVRIFLNGAHAASGEGRDTWPDRLHIARQEWTDIFGFLKKYEQDVSGIVLYDSENPHMRNLASTAANVQNALPVEKSVYEILKQHDFSLPVLTDLTCLSLKTPPETYMYLYEHYWKDCSKRLFFSLKPTNSCAHVRDLAAAAGGAVVDLDARIPEEQKCLDLFLQDLTAGKSLILGWWQEERSGVGEGSKYGISTIPADYYENATVYASFPHAMHIPPVPKMPKLENKIYLAIFMSDGDNIQYCQHYLPILWKDSKRGSVPLNWTASPALVDIGPGILNYFFDTASEADCICSGPSGLGYALIYDDSNKVICMKDTDKTDAYTKLSNTYLMKNGMRVVTAWDQLWENHLKCYEQNMRAVYGLTLQYPEKEDLHIENNRLCFIRNFPPYAEDPEKMYNSLKETILNYDGKEPLFLAAQGVTWKLGPENMEKLIEMFEELRPNTVKVLRGDHFFALLNEEKGLPFNLSLSPNVSVRVNDPKDASVILNGSPYGKNCWTASGEGSKEFVIDLGENYLLSRYVLKLAGVNEEDASLNNRSFVLSVSQDETSWADIDDRKDNADDVIDADFSPVSARYLRLLVREGGADHMVRIGDLEIYGARV